MRRLLIRLSSVFAIAALAGALSVVPAFAQGPYGSGGGMSYGAPAPAAGSGSSAPAAMGGAPSSRARAGGMAMLSTAGGAGALYRVRAGDTLTRIAARFGASPLSILLANPSIVNANRIFVGQFLFIPSRFIDNDHDADDTGSTLYRVRFGDTLLRIARRFGVSEGALLRANPFIFNRNLIFAGQVLVIPMTSAMAGRSSSGSAMGASAVPPAPPAAAAATPMPPMTMPGAQGTPAPTQAPMQAPPGTPAPRAQTVTVNLTAHNLMFNMSTITVPAGAHVTVNFNNQDAGVLHNFAIYADSSAGQAIFKGQIVTGPGTMTYTFTAPSQPGTYFFRCDVHPTMMNGQFVVR